jgi:hypothetical protein
LRVAFYIQDVLLAFNLGKDDFDASKLRYGKVIIMTALPQREGLSPGACTQSGAGLKRAGLFH